MSVLDRGTKAKRPLCCLCEKEIEPEYNTDGEVIWDQGHNPFPVSTVGGDRCCTNCNNLIVVPPRIRDFELKRGVNR